MRLKRPPHRQLRTPEGLEPDPKAYVVWSSQPLTAFETYNGRSTFDVGTALPAPQLTFAIAVGMALLGDGKQSIACLKPSDAVAYG